MINPPLFQDDILTHLWNFNVVTFTSRLWVPWMFFVALVLSGLAFALRTQLRKAPVYFNLFSSNIYKFNRRRKREWTALFILLGALVLTAMYMYHTENSFFETFDQMSLGTMRTLDIGQVVNFDYARIVPFAFWNLSTLYAITQNMYLVKAFVFVQLLLAVYLLYRFFDYIPTTRRLIMLAVLLLTPTFLLTSKIVFPDREILIALCASLLCVRCYSRFSQLRWVYAFLFFMNVAIYTKETCILFFTGILATSILYAIWNEKIRPQDFLHPIKIIKSMPLEFLMGISLLLYSIIYFLLSTPNDTNTYLVTGRHPISTLLIYYRFELAVLLAAVLLLLVRARRNYDTTINPMFRGGLVVGALMIALVIILVLKTAPNSPHLRGKSYYLLLTLLFSTAYLFEHIRSRVVILIFSGAMLFYSAIKDFEASQQELGKYYRETAEFFAQNLDKEKINYIFLIEKPQANKGIDKWIVEAWASSYQYYFKDYKIVFKSNQHLVSGLEDLIHLKQFTLSIYKPLIPAKLPESGDWVVVNKYNDWKETRTILSSLPKTPVYENEIMAIYRAQ